MESLPLRLMVVAAVAAMSIAPAAEALETLQDREFLSKAGLTLDRVVNTAQVISMEGPGARRTVEVDLSSEGSLRGQRLMIGDALGGARANAAVLELSTGAKLVRLAEDPPVRMVSESGQALEVELSTFSLVMEAVQVDGTCVVVLGVR